jgi:ATP phosphoribosyltransferase regulatory subunit
MFETVIIMKPYAIQLPNGARDNLFSECRIRRELETALADLFEQRGYNEIIPPTLEYYDTFLRTGNTLPEEEMYKVIDRDGRIMVMRPDLTTPIARVYATKLKQVPDPQRLYYIQNIFRSGHSLKGQDTEITQAGVELIGTNNFKSDLEIISLAVKALEICSVKRFHIEIGHSGLFRALLQQLNCGEDTAEEIRRYTEQKNFAALNDLLEEYRNMPAMYSLTRLVGMFGGEEILGEARTLWDDAESQSCIDYLESLYRELKLAGMEEYIRFDLGLVNKINYYTGIVFLGYAEGIGEPVLAGGRYDGLTAVFGAEAPATGFGINLNSVIRQVPQKPVEPRDTLIHYEAGRLGAAISILSDASLGRSELSPCDTVENTIRLAMSRNAKRVLVLRESGQREEIIVERTETGLWTE